MRRVDAGAAPAGAQGCVHCHRTPLVGETVYLYGERMVCELCRPLRREAPGRERGRALGRARPHRQAPLRRLAHYSARSRWTPSPRTSSIDRPREEVFEYLADIANHPEFSDHYLKEWRLTRVESFGRGAGARFKIDAPLDRFGWGDMTFIEVERPLQDRRRRPRREVQPQQDLDDVDARRPRAAPTRVEVTTESEPALPTDKLMEAVTRRRGWYQARPRQGAAPPAVDPRGGHGPRRARHRRRVVTSAARCVRARVPAAVAAVAARRAAATRSRYVTRRRDRGRLRRRRRPDVPGPALALPEPGRRRGHAVPARACRRRRPSPAGDEIWFGVWMRVKNYTDGTLTPTDDFAIVDTEGNEFEPVPLDGKRTRSPTSRMPLEHAPGAADAGHRRRPAARSRAR